MASKEYYLLQSVIRDLQSVVLADVSSQRARLVGNLGLEILKGIQARLADAALEDFDALAIHKAVGQLSAALAGSEDGESPPPVRGRLDEIVGVSNCSSG